MGEWFGDVGLPVALAIIMFGLGLTLTPADFRMVARRPKPAIVALGCQLLLLPAVCLGLVLLLRLEPPFAVGMMLLAASPGGTTASLFSHLFGGDVALNIALTAVNSVLALVTMPVVAGLALHIFMPGSGALAMQPGEVLRVVAIVLVPVAVGLLVRRVAPSFAARMSRPVRIGSAVVLLLVVVGAVGGELDILLAALPELAFVTTCFCVLSFAFGLLVPRALRIARRQAISTGFEVGVHNTTLALVAAISVIGVDAMALPIAIYGIVMLGIAVVFGVVVRRFGRTAPDPAAAAADAHRE